MNCRMLGVGWIVVWSVLRKGFLVRSSVFFFFFFFEENIFLKKEIREINLDDFGGNVISW